MADFKDIFISESYLEPYCLFIGCKGLVFVEGLKDIPFWDGILNDINNDELKYEVNYASHEGTRGKTVLLKFFHLANRFAIFAIDSDFDYICPNNSDSAKKFNSNNFILQTIAYSKESINLHHSVISECLSEIKIKRAIEFSVKEYFQSYSSEIYQPLLRFLFLKEKGKAMNDSEFHEKIKPSLPIIIDDYKLANDPFENIKKEKDKIEIEYTSLEFSDAEFLTFKEELSKKGLVTDTAIYYINGHFLEDSIVMPLVTGLIKRLKGKELEKIKKECAEKPQLIEDSRSEAFKYIDDELGFNRILHINKSKFKTQLSKRITEENKKALG